MLYDGVIAAARLTGRWRHPIDASGDLETMTTRDLIYWVYKSAYSTTHAQRLGMRGLVGVVRQRV